MKRFIASIALFLATTVAWGQGYNPEIAYTQVAGKSATLYLANRDGTKAVAVYSVPTKTRHLGAPDFAPGGGRIAFVDTGSLKVLSYTVTPTGISVTDTITLDNGYVDSPDFSPNGNSILYTTYSQAGGSQIKMIAASSGSMPVHLAWTRPTGVSQARNLRWLRSGDAFVFLTTDITNNPILSYQVRRALLSPDNTISVTTLFTTTGQEFGNMEDIDIVRTGNAILGSANYPESIRILTFDIDRYDRGEAPFAETGAQGFRAHASPNDTHILHHSVDGKSLFVFNTVTETDIRIAGNGRSYFGYTDWKP